MIRSPVPVRPQVLPTSMLCPPETKPAPKSMHVSLAGESAKIVYLNVNVNPKLGFARLTTPPPPDCAMLLLIVTLFSVAFPLSCMIAAPESAELP